MKVINIRGVGVDALVGPEHGATRMYIWCVTAQAGQVIGMHHHNGEELIRVLYGRLHFRVENATREVGAGEVVILPAGTRHGYRALEDTEIEEYGEIGAGEFLTVRDADGTMRTEEVFVVGAPWSRKPVDSSQYLTHEELLAKYQASVETDPLDLPQEVA